MTNIKKLFSQYFVSVKPLTNDYHQIHKDDCPFLPEKEKRILLGHFDSGNEALTESKSYFKRSECCRFCMKEHSHKKSELVFFETEFAEHFQVSTISYASYDEALHSYQN